MRPPRRGGSTAISLDVDARLHARRPLREFAMRGSVRPCRLPAISAIVLGIEREQSEEEPGGSLSPGNDR